jgi:ubiquitin-protein ligase
MNTTSHYRPSKRPKVGDVKNWYLVFDDTIDSHWRGEEYDGRVQVYNGYPFPDFYKVVSNLGKPTVKKSKLFYGESAYHNMVRYVSDLGFNSIYSANL